MTLKYNTFHQLDKLLGNTKGKTVEISQVDQNSIKNVDFYRKTIADSEKVIVVSVKRIR